MNWSEPHPFDIHGSWYEGSLRGNKVGTLIAEGPQSTGPFHWWFNGKRRRIRAATLHKAMSVCEAASK